MAISHAIEDMGKLAETDLHLYRYHSPRGVTYNTHGGSGGYSSLAFTLWEAGLPQKSVAHLLHCFDAETQKSLQQL